MTPLIGNGSVTVGAVARILATGYLADSMTTTRFAAPPAATAQN